MNIIRVSATKARNNFFDLLNQVSSGTSVIIERDSKEVAILSPQPKTDIKALLKAAKASHGILKNYTPEEIVPARYKGKWKRLGKWDESSY